MPKKKNKKNPIVVEIGKRIRKVRVKNNLSIEELANKLDITKSYLSKIENGNGRPNVFILRKLNEIFKIPVEYILDITVSEYYSRQFLGKDIGLTDKTIERLKYMQKTENESFRHIDILNAIFDSGIDEALWRALYNYFFKDLKYMNIETQFKDCDRLVVKTFLNTYEEDPVYIQDLSVRDINKINELVLLDKLEEIKNELKLKGYEIQKKDTTNLEDTNANKTDSDNDKERSSEKIIKNIQNQINTDKYLRGIKLE